MLRLGLPFVLVFACATAREERGRPSTSTAVVDVTPASSSAATPLPPADPEPRAAPLELARTCALPEAPKALVLGVVRRTLPIGRGPTLEQAELTTDGACAPGIQCVRLERKGLMALYALLRNTADARIVHGSASPHYGYFSVSARWDSGTCEIADSSLAQVERADQPRFQAAWEALFAAAAGQ